MLDGAAILAHVVNNDAPGSPGEHTAGAVTIEIVEETGSTNADLLARVGAGIDSLDRPTLRIARHQTAGRGRAGRSWLSAPGSTLMFSLAWPFAGPLTRLAGLPLAVGVALAETLAALDVPVTLKWPNDLIKDGGKLAGILVETRIAADQSIWAVIGAGINLLMPDQLEQQIGRDVASAPWLAQMDRNRLMAMLLARLTAVLTEFDDAGFAPFAARWNRLHAHQDRAVTIHDQGRLLLDTAQGRIAILSGDVSLRPKEA